MFSSFCSVFGYDENKFSIDENLVIKIINRLDQRRLHYKIFHQGLEISELKEIAILCYWFNRLKPITYNNGTCYSTEKYNEFFSLYLMVCIIREYNNVRGISSQPLTQEIVEDLMYNFAYREISIDSLTLLIDSLV